MNQPDTKNVVTVERLIPAAPADIFALLADPARHQDIDGSGTVKTAKSAIKGSASQSGPLKLGSRFGMNMHRGISYSMISTVIDFEQDRRIAWRSFPPFPLSLVIGGRIWRYQLDPVEAGTMVRETWDVTHERIPLLVQRDAPTARRGMTATLARIEELLTSA